MRQQATVLSVWLHSPANAASAPAHPEANTMARMAAMNGVDTLSALSAPKKRMSPPMGWVAMRFLE